MTRVLHDVVTQFEATEEEIDNLIEKAKLRQGRSMGRAQAQHVIELWPRIVKDCIDIQFGEKAEVESFGWFKAPDLDKIAALSKMIDGVKGIPFTVDGKTKFKYVGYYFDENGKHITYCNGKDIDEGDSFVEIHFLNVADDGTKFRDKIVINRGGRRIKELEHL